MTPEQEKRTYPIAEIFTSIQGEGQYAGTLMTFVRFAGCTVGKPYTQVEKDAYMASPGPPLQIYQERCTAWDGKSFPCDTNYRMTERLTAEEIVARTHGARFVLLTGGEPLMHPLLPVVRALFADGGVFDRRVHIETSGTYDFLPYQRQGCWITVSPKRGYELAQLYRADEIKILVRASDFDFDQFNIRFGTFFDSQKLWIQPVNDEAALIEANVQACIAIIHMYPNIRLSTQLHKVWNVR